MVQLNRKQYEEKMTVLEFMARFLEEIKDLDPNAEVRILSTYWSNVYGYTIDSPVTNIGIDEKHGIVYIEIEKTDG